METDISNVAGQPRKPIFRKLPAQDHESSGGASHFGRTHLLRLVLWLRKGHI